MSKSTPELHRMGPEENALYRVAVSDLAMTVNRMAVAVGTARALALLSAATGHLYGAVYAREDDCGEHPHLANFRMGTEEGRAMRLRGDEAEGTA